MLAKTPRHEEHLETLQSHLSWAKGWESRAAKAAHAEPGSELDALRAKAAKLQAEIRLREGQHPATTPEELDALHDIVAAAQAAYDKCYRMFRAHTGYALDALLAGQKCASARAELEMARGEHAAAIRYQRMACAVAGGQVDVAKAYWQAGKVTVDGLCEAQTKRATARLKLLQWESRYESPTAPNAPAVIPRADPAGPPRAEPPAPEPGEPFPVQPKAAPRPTPPETPAQPLPVMPKLPFDE